MELQSTFPFVSAPCIGALSTRNLSLQTERLDGSSLNGLRWKYTFIDPAGGSTPLLGLALYTDGALVLNLNAIVLNWFEFVIVTTLSVCVVVKGEEYVTTEGETFMVTMTIIISCSEKKITGI